MDIRRFSGVTSRRGKRTDPVTNPNINNTTSTSSDSTNTSTPTTIKNNQKKMGLSFNNSVKTTVIVAIVLVTFNISLSQVHAIDDAAATIPNVARTNSTAEKGGRCPDARMESRLCGDQIDQCTTDQDCAGDSLCCSTGCNKVCILPAYTACEQAKNSAERRARSLEPEDAKSVKVPECDAASGKFKQVQCDGNNGCYCVDKQGFEMPGTRARSLDLVNCTNPRPCDGPMCRMLCPYGFELDPEQGCEICECKNVCKGVKCPMDTRCEVEEAPCTTKPCPPIPSCKQPRSLDSLCTYGAPLIIPESGNPFLCGTDPGKPSCPAAFECNVKTGNDYGVCCASNKNFEKPGNCPVVATTKDSSISDGSQHDECITSCRHDLDCTDFDKCCFTQGCGKQCSKPANSTACLQQKHIAELLSQKELEGKGYIPQCDENGNFIAMQCSRNGKVCWCVGPDGKNYPQSIGPAESVNCTNTQQRQRAALRSDDSYGCDKVICSITCEFGFKTDRNGCPTCDCVKSPCENFLKCPTGSKCEMISDPSCNYKDECPMRPTCLSDSLFVNPCPLGTPLTDMGSGQVVACSETATTCPSSHICVIVSPNKAGLCCANRPRVEPTKAGMCPFLAPSICNTNSTLGQSNKKCSTDNDCENSMKCCAAGDCTLCADPLLHGDIENSKESPTMCQYLRDAGEKVGGIYNKFKLAIVKPQCKINGEFNEVQCDGKRCMCVDEYGAEIPRTMMAKEVSNLTEAICLKARNNPKCLEMNCRLACDYGYETLDGCRICECRNPCMSKNECEEEDQCEMVDIDCWDGHCPPLPFCIPKALAASSKDMSNPCPKGSAFVTESNETLTCNPRARMLQCPDEYFCHARESSYDVGYCCPILSEEEANHLILAENRHGSAEDLGIFSGNVLLRDGSINAKMGQCPYLIPFSSSASCQSDCMNDYDCQSSGKCCLNSCGGTQCTEPLLMTACQHQKVILEHKARESGIPTRRVFIPECDETGEYLRVQSFAKFRWCVDSAGHELQGTRVPVPQKPNCQKPSQCPQTTCSLQCEFGLQLDTKGCPICECKPSPCDDVKCERGEECRMMQLNCISEPCPPVPLCLPRLENPCVIGAPLSHEESGDRVSCGPAYGSCPSSHRCNTSPFGEYSVCCPKPKEVCFEQRESGNCKAVITKWFFNSSSNECQQFFYSGCGGNSNQFDSKDDCLAVCPALTHCERMREKNTELVKKYHHMSYIPTCNPRNGDWESAQCFEEVGMCWCVNKKGEPIKGSMTNGVPKCQARRGRLLGASTPDPLVCKPGVTVHKCNKSLCSQKVCLGHPTAKCMVNPCGGCNERWISEEGKELDCNFGLTKCHKEMQQVMNMNAQVWVNQVNPSVSSTEKQDNADEYSEFEAASSLGNALSSILLGEDRDHRQGRMITQMSTKVTPIFANFGGHHVMGLVSSSVTVMGGSSSEEDHNPRPNRVVSPVRSIADILAEMMTSQSGNQHPSESRGYPMDDYMDLMPTSSHVYPSREMLPPPPMVPDFAFPGNGIPLARVRRETIPDSMSVESSSVEDVITPRREILVSIIPTRKGGNCPQPSHFALFNLLTGACQDECHYDNECEAHMKCCLSKCGLKCVIPESMDASVVEIDDEDSPSPNMVAPQYEELEPPTMMVTLPQCNMESGDYTPVQSQGDLSWCVNSSDGQPIQASFTRGKVVCSANGTILERYIRGPICLDPEQTPMICRDQCLHASCPLHPDAICVMDVCDNCRPAFYMASGEKVRCEEKCQQPSGEPGYCRASIIKFTFNSTSGKCEEFIYGGCQGNDNNFDSRVQCQNDCEKNGIDACNLSKKPGPCRASMLRWFFNPESQSCEQFDYGGCGGNENNFMTKDHCETRCPDIVLCPNIIDGEMKSCSRTAACKNATCPGQQADDYICSVDPCTCQAILKDFNGNLVQCEEESAADSVSSRGDSLEFSSSHHNTGHSDSSYSPEDSQHDDSSKVHSLEGSFSENQVLRVGLDPSTIKPRCLSFAQESEGVVSCTSEGRFSPLQCIHFDSTDPSPTCFCVDEAGQQGNITFPQGSLTCPEVPIEKVGITLKFPIWDDISTVQLGVELQQLLRTMNAELEEEKVEIEVVPGSTNVRFVLIGEHNVEVAHKVEQLVKGAALGVEEQGKVYAALLSASTFNYVASSLVKPLELNFEEEGTTFTTTLDEINDNGEADNEVNVDQTRRKEGSDDDEDDREKLLRGDAVSAESLALNEEYNTVAIMLTLVAAITAGLVVFGMFLAFQKKKSTGSYPKNPFETLAFSSQVYEIEKKVPIPKDTCPNPTFKATPYMNEYKNQDEKSYSQNKS